ncbi:ABC transporter permease subunit [Mucilaginibacter sp. UYCu711]|uniref:ABC transporter permease subunit n=1 Tax=Mucilaginibacter sp. UYCu711 TaxID=3156339 RepID=UPI003D1D0596
MNLQLMTIIAFDWKQLVRSRIFWFLNALMLVIGWYAAVYGNGQVHEQQQKIALLQQSIDSNMSVVKKKFDKQDTVASWHYDDWLYALHANRPDGMAALAFGQRDLHKFAVSITIGTYFYNRYAGGYENKTLSGEIVNPRKQFAGHLDISFIIVFLLPLYLLLISYNLLSAEQENGTFSLLALQKVNVLSIIMIKLILRLGITVLLGWLIVFIGAIITSAIGDARLIYLLAVTLLYMLGWASIISLVIAFHWSSGTNALILISIWLFFCLALPAAFTAVINARYPQGTKSDLVAAVQRSNAHVFNISRRALSVEFYKAYPQYNNMPKDTFPGGWYNPRWMRAVHLLLDKEVEPLEIQYQEKLQARIKVADAFDYYSPALTAQAIFNRAAASDMEQMFVYDNSIYHHFSAWRDYLDGRTYLHHDVLTHQEFNNLPVAGFKPKINFTEINKRLTALFIGAAGFSLLSLIVFKKGLFK